jgi:hypothetical protein
VSSTPSGCHQGSKFDTDRANEAHWADRSWRVELSSRDPKAPVLCSCKGFNALGKISPITFIRRIRVELLNLDAGPTVL